MSDPSFTANIDPLIRDICKARVARTNAAPWWTEKEIVQAIVEDIHRAGYRVVPAVSADIPLRLFKEARHGR